MNLLFHTIPPPIRPDWRFAGPICALVSTAEDIGALKAGLPKAFPSCHTLPTPPMPTISRFYGITITLRAREQNHPRAHFHAEYGEFEASIAVDNFQILDGQLPRRAMELTIMWAALHRDELQANWDALRAGQLPAKIEPLE
jgi:hypothetical protein